MRFATNIKPLLQQIRLLTGLNVEVKRSTWLNSTCSAAMLQDKLHVLLFVARFYAPLPKWFLQVFLFYVILAISYLRTRTIETSSLPSDSMRPLFKQIEIFLSYLLYISTVNTFLNPFLGKFLGRNRPLKILPTRNLFLGIDLNSMLSNLTQTVWGYIFLDVTTHSVTKTQ